MLVRCGRPVLGSRLIVPVLSFLSEFSVQLTFHRFFLSENILHKPVAITFAVSQLVIKCLSLAVNRMVAEEISVSPVLRYQYQRTFIHQFKNFYIDKIRIYSATVTKIFV